MLAALVAGGGVAAWQLSRPKPAPEPRTPIVRAVTALGRLTPAGGLVNLSIASGTAGGNEVVETWFVKEGSEIRKGQLLARLSSYGPLQASLEQAEADLSATRSLLPFLEISKSKGTELFSEGAISEEELGKAQAGVTGRRADIRSGEAAVARARLQLEAAEVRSPLDGRLIRIYSWPGMKETSDGLALVGRTDQMQVWAQVFQTDIPRLSIGQGATVQAESGGFTGTLRASLEAIIGNVSERDLFSVTGNNDVNSRVVLVKLNLAPEDRPRVSRLSGLNVTVRFDP
ncbi:ABC-transporter membrane fusion protein [Cyanobium sp. PCC 7001]|uniref:HlyD family efflux transporter periplasmic adaptor subunit n=1 Tax=Cyanobium sp. PCC 7001 TaxID=180281 RepID=UPI00018048C3|nr:HlyD family efflux transporter periplasmic adaptor subunit [Cyanobium sp. PCC 7001]EDY39759.1 ABC-transporter membrane fusion protein [Cyanobium sp. PCC 7001]